MDLFQNARLRLDCLSLADKYTNQIKMAEQFYNFCMHMPDSVEKQPAQPVIHRKPRVTKPKTKAEPLPTDPAPSATPVFEEDIEPVYKAEPMPNEAVSHEELLA